MEIRELTKKAGVHSITRLSERKFLVVFQPRGRAYTYHADNLFSLAVRLGVAEPLDVNREAEQILRRFTDHGEREFETPAPIHDTLRYFASLEGYRIRFRSEEVGRDEWGRVVYRLTITKFEEVES